MEQKEALPEICEFYMLLYSMESKKSFEYFCKSSSISATNEN